MARGTMLRLDGENQLLELQRRMGYRGSDVQPSTQAQYGRRGEMVDMRPLERDVQDAIMKLLRFHKAVAWATRVNTGAMKIDDRIIKFMFKGAADIWGQMADDGRLLVIEVKRLGEKPTAEQRAFLELVSKHGGVAFCASSIDDVIRKLGCAT